MPLSLGGLNGITNVAGNGGYDGYVRVNKPSGTVTPKQWLGMATWSGNNFQVSTIAGRWTGITAVDGFQIAMSSGNITSGRVRIYGRL